jgi:hypothetical protein
VESDPLAELARLIGQTDPFGPEGRTSAKAQPRSAPEPYQPPEEAYEELPPVSPPGPPAWMRRANVQAQPSAPLPQQDYPDPQPVHPLHRYGAAQHTAPEQDYHQPEYHPQEAYREPEEQPDPSRYDDALYGQLESVGQDYQRDPAYPDDPYAYQGDYPEDLEEEAPKRRAGMITVAAVLALAVVGTGAAFAYRTYIGSPRSSEPPIIKADNSPTKIVPAPSDGAPKLPDRMVSGDGTEKIVPREEAPVDINARSAPRVVFPPLNQNANPPPVASVAPPSGTAVVPNNGTMPNNEPRKIKTLAVRGDQTDNGTAPVTGAAAKQPAGAPKTTAALPPATPRTPPTQANASANGPLSLAPQGAPPQADGPTRLAATNPTQVAPINTPATSSSGGYLVQVSSQRNEADAQASYRALQSKFPTVLGSHAPVIRRADLGERGVYYRAMVGPFGTSEEASQFCGSLKSAGGQCVVQRN